MGNVSLAVRAVAVVTAAAIIAGCATSKGGSSTSTDWLSGECNPLIAGGIGAVIGAIAGGRNNRGAGAAIGAGVGALACVAYDYYAKQTKSAQQVSDEYKATHMGTLPTRATVTRFNTEVSPASTVQAGSAVTVASDIEVVPGTDNPKPKVEQAIVLYGPDGTPAGNARKAASQGGGGAFATSFKFSMPQGIPQGVYPVKSQVFVDGQPAGHNDARFQVVVGPGGQATVLALQTFAER